MRSKKMQKMVLAAISIVCMCTSICLIGTGCGNQSEGVDAGGTTQSSQTGQEKDETDDITGTVNESGTSQTDMKESEAETETETEMETETAAGAEDLSYLFDDSSEYTDMIKASLISTGNNVRLKKVIEKMRAGEQVWIATVGGSITEGANASSNEKCYAYQMYRFLADTYGAGDGENVHFINAGLSGTPSTLGVVRYDAYTSEICGCEPDLVIVEFAVNDGDDPTNGDCYESLVRKILLQENEPAVVLLFSVFETMWNLQDRLEPVGEFYDLPMVSIKDGIKPAIDVNYMGSSDFFSSDGWHPTDYGHIIMADCMKYLFSQVDAETADDEDNTAAVLSSGQVCIGNSFEDEVMLDCVNADANEAVELSKGSFSLADTGIGTLRYDYSRKTFPNNWKRDTSSSEGMVIKLNCKNFILTYKLVNSSAYGAIDVYVDGEKKTTINANSTSGWNNPFTAVIFNEKEAAEHTIEIKMAAGDEAKDFTIMAMGYSE